MQLSNWWMNYLFLLRETILDFKKTFKRVDHTILLKKLSMFGIKASLKWLEKYLTNRLQYIEIEKAPHPFYM